jgi:short-subunit dehydrogenase
VVAYTGKVIVLTGASQGIGRALALRLADEQHKRATGSDGQALGTTPMKEDRIMSAEQCANRTVSAMPRRQRMLVFTAKGKLGRFAKLVAPGLVDRIARRAVERGR